MINQDEFVKIKDEIISQLAWINSQRDTLFNLIKKRKESNDIVRDYKNFFHMVFYTLYRSIFLNIYKMIEDSKDTIYRESKKSLTKDQQKELNMLRKKCEKNNNIDIESFRKDIRNTYLAHIQFDEIIGGYNYESFEKLGGLPEIDKMILLCSELWSFILSKIDKKINNSLSDRNLTKMTNRYITREVEAIFNKLLQ